MKLKRSSHLPKATQVGRVGVSPIILNLVFLFQLPVSSNMMINIMMILRHYKILKVL